MDKRPPSTWVEVAARTCPNCNRPIQPGEPSCRYCGFVFPFATGNLSPRALLRGRYEIQSLIHSGGMGFVYLAKDKNLFDRVCVVKQVRDRIQSKEHQVKLEEEALSMSRLNHPNIAMIFDHFVEADHYFLVVEYIRGKTLTEVFEERKGHIEEAEVVKWAKTICDVIIYLHSEGVIHRDISPDNIMLTPEGGIKFIDFGTLRELRQVAAGGTAGMGKFGLSPPEQWKGAPEPRSDIFALGATLYYLLSGFIPLSNAYRVGEGPQREDFNPDCPPIRIRNPDVSMGLEKILQKALRLEINRRYKTAGEMRHDIETADSGIRDKVEDSSKGKQPKRSRLVVTVFVAVMVLGGIGVGAYFLVKSDGSTSPGISGDSQPAGPISEPATTSAITPTPAVIRPTNAAPDNIANGRIILVNHNDPRGDLDAAHVDLSYRNLIGSSGDIKMTDGLTIDSGYTLPPGTYTISEYASDIWHVPVVVIDDPSEGSFVAGRNASVSLIAGETVTVTFYNSRSPRPALSAKATVDQENREPSVPVSRDRPGSCTRFQTDSLQLGRGGTAVEAGWTFPPRRGEFNRGD